MLIDAFLDRLDLPRKTRKHYRALWQHDDASTPEALLDALHVVLQKPEHRCSVAAWHCYKAGRETLNTAAGRQWCVEHACARLVLYLSTVRRQQTEDVYHLDRALDVLDVVFGAAAPRVTTDALL